MDYPPKGYRLDHRGLLWTARAITAYRARKGDEPIHRDTFVWRDSNRFVKAMDDIEDSHLLNIVRYIEGRGELEPAPRDDDDEDFLKRHLYNLLREEIDRRGLVPREDTADEAKLRDEARHVHMMRDRAMRAQRPIEPDEYPGAEEQWEMETRKSAR